MSQLWDAEVETSDDEPDHGLADAVVTPLPESVYWGKDIADERYLVVSRS
jgi:hypothetical protein